MAAKESPKGETAPEGTGASGPASEHTRHTRNEGALALRNALKLASSLVLTWGVALFVTFKLPKYLGPTFYGHYKYGEQFAMSAAVFLSLGVDTYVSREVALRPKHASDFFGGVLLTRAVAVLPIAAVSLGILHGQVGERSLAAVLFGCAYVFTALNQTFQQTLQAASKVGRLAIANVVSKVLWGGGTIAAVLLGAPFWVLPLPLVLSEGLKSLVLFMAVKDAVDLELRLDVAATKKVLAISFPFFIANVAVALGSSIDVVVLGGIVSQTSEEVGWYGSARQIAQLSALLSPILSGVLIPMMSRAKARDEQEFFRILRRCFEGVMVVSIPLTLMLALGADFLVALLLKDAFLPAASSLRWLAPTFVLAYGNVLLWLALMILDRSWTITVVSIAGLLLLPIFIYVAVPLTRDLGPGGAGMGTAIAMSARELVILGVFIACLGGGALDARARSSTIKSLLICGVVVAAHLAMAKLGPARLVVDALVYLVLMVALGILRPSDVRLVLQLVRDRKKAA
jgi:O-antigen/teichoic acid export membrane protein